MLSEADGKRHRVYPYDRKYTKNSGDQTDKQSVYSLNVLNLEGEVSAAWSHCQSVYTL